MPRIVVLGTGTDVGKTYTTRRLAAALAADPANYPVAALKPIESGVTNTPNSGSVNVPPQLVGRAEEALAKRPFHTPLTDAAMLAAESRPQFEPPAHAYSFSESVSPHLAARLNGESIDISVAAAWVKTHERSITTTHHNTSQYPSAKQPSSVVRRPWILVETAGAALSPLAKGVTNLEFARLLDPAIWILVAPDRLGVLHDLTTTLHTMRDLGRPPDSIVLSQATAPDQSTGTNASELRELGIAEIDAVLARGESLPSDYPARLHHLVTLLAL